MILLDTSVAIPIRDNDPGMVSKLLERARQPYISIVTEIELYGGARGSSSDPVRRQLLSLFIDTVEILPLTDRESAVYGAIVEISGFSRRKILDRLIAATAVSHGLPLATMNPGDFADVPALEVQDWG